MAAPWVLPGQPLHYSEWCQGGATTAPLWQQFLRPAAWPSLKA
ncbi:hypothetical protein [Ideonella paludis]